MEKAMSILMAAHKAWNSGADMRARRNRYKQYTYGNQWGDLIADDHGNIVTEGEYASASGKKPLSNNLIRRLVKCIVGRFRTEHINALGGDAMRKVSQMNHLDELDSRMLEEFLISGCAIQRVVEEHRPGMGMGVWIDNVSPSRFFVNATSDPRGWDVEMVGMLHDMSLTEVMMRYSHGSREKARELRRLYADDAELHSATQALGLSVNDSLDFFRAGESRCRVIEVWTLESREVLRCHDALTGEYYCTGIDREPELIATNAMRREQGEDEVAMRWEIATRWHCRFLSPSGDVLDEMDSPYRHGLHPFAVKLYPLTDGEVHSFVEDVIDQQRYVNRLITLIDHIMGASAKGVLMFPDNQRSETMTWEQIGRLWSSCNGVIPYRPKNGEPGPQQISSNCTNIGAYELLNLEMKLFEDISGVSQAFQGREAASGTAASLYNAQAANSAISLADIFATFNDFRHCRNRLVEGTR